MITMRRKLTRREMIILNGDRVVANVANNVEGLIVGIHNALAPRDAYIEPRVLDVSPTYLNTKPKPRGGGGF